MKCCLDRSRDTKSEKCRSAWVVMHQTKIAVTAMDESISDNLSVPYGLEVASDVVAGFALPPRSADPGRPVADALRASADGTCHVGDLVIGPDEFGIEDGLNRLDHRNSLFGRESGKKALHDLFDFSDVLLHEDKDELCV